MIYSKAAALLPPTKFLKRHDPKFLELLRSNRTAAKIDSTQFQKHLKANWRFNTTLMDLDWYTHLKKTDSDDQYDLGHDPYAIVDHFDDDTLPSRPGKATKLYDVFAPFFIDTARAMRQLRGRLQIEVVLGDYVDVAEQIRFGMYRDPSNTVASASRQDTRQGKFPITFDRIHLSNIPYVILSHR